jgi:hypothetical protein
MAVAQMQTTAQEDHVRAAIESVLAAQGGVTVENAPGQLVMDLGGTVGSAYLAGGFRNKMKMPMRIVVKTAGGPGGTGLTIDVHSRGTAAGIMSGGWLGASKQDKAEKVWLQMALDGVTKVSGGPPPEIAPPPLEASPPPPGEPPAAGPPREGPPP